MVCSNPLNRLILICIISLDRDKSNYTCYRLFVGFSVRPHNQFTLWHRIQKLFCKGDRQLQALDHVNPFYVRQSTRQSLYRKRACCSYILFPPIRLTNTDFNFTTGSRCRLKKNQCSLGEYFKITSIHFINFQLSKPQEPLLHQHNKGLFPLDSSFFGKF